jgi:archaellum component FlaC|tara:strand:- start:4368 stop:4607 length:240 start_codon:yes stop_codon:yes gene_type:complete
MDISPILFWNAIITLVYLPTIYSIRQNAQTIDRLEVLVNKTREEIPKYYVTKQDLHKDIERIFDRLDKLDEKIDKLIGQ